MQVEYQPYVGPRPFQQDDSRLFFGRDREARDLVGLIVSNRAVFLHAPSGAGKTSLLNAKLIPFLKEEGFQVLPTTRVVRPIPETLKQGEITNVYIFNTLVGCSETPEDSTNLAKMTFREFLSNLERSIDEFGQPQPLVVILDQFEELFFSFEDRWTERERFFQQITEALQYDRYCRTLFVMRDEFLGSLSQFEDIFPERICKYHVDRLRERAALSAITAPIKTTGRAFASGVAESLVQKLLEVTIQKPYGEHDTVLGEFVEPVHLQIVCQSLWEQLPANLPIITADQLRDFGDVDRPLEAYFESALQKVAADTNVKEGALRSWFERVLITTAGTRAIVFRGSAETEGISNLAIDVLEQMHLIRAELRGGERWYELTHDRFIEPIRDSNRRWLHSFSGTETDLRRLEEKAEAWIRGKSGLLDKTELREAERLLSSAGAIELGYSDALRTFVQASAAVKQPKQVQRLSVWLVVTVILVLLTLSLAIFGWMQHSRVKELEQLLEQHK